MRRDAATTKRPRLRMAEWNARVNAEASMLPAYVPVSSVLPTHVQELVKQ